MKEEFKEFEEKFGQVFTKEELEEIKYWFNDECRNAGTLGVTDRKFRGKGVREKIIEWLNSHPDDFTVNFKKQTGETFDVRDACR